VTPAKWMPVDLVRLLREKAEIETSDNSICITQHLDHMAAEEIERLRENVARLLSLLGRIDQTER
jgi:hypothetical protein